MYGAGITSPDVPIWARRVTPTEDASAPLLPAISVVPAAFVVSLDAKLTLLMAEVKTLKDKVDDLERKSKRGRRRK